METAILQLREFDRKIKRYGLSANRIVLFSAHQMGTCRMGVYPNDGYHQVDGVKVLYGSALPSACGVNPMLSIIALAHKASQYLKTEVGIATCGEGNL